MWTRSRLLLAVLSAALALALSAGTAAAGRLGLSATNFTIRWRELLVPTGLGSGEGEVARCPLTLSGSFHSGTLAKVIGGLVGSVTAGQMATCANGTATLLRTGLPWHLAYRGFTGALPAVATVRLALAGLGLSIFSTVLGRTCLLRTSATEPLELDFNREAAGAITAVRVTTPTSILTDCGLRWDVAGSASLEQGTGRSVTVTLI